MKLILLINGEIHHNKLLIKLDSQNKVIIRMLYTLGRLEIKLRVLRAINECDE